jgi:hypothetical protein
MECPKCGSESIATDHDSGDGNTLRICLDCDRGWTDWQQSENKWLKSELDAVMQSVAKWFDKPTDDNPATRATDAREIALKEIVRLREGLRKLEWAEGGCPVCMSHYSEGHDHDCWLAKLLEGK